MTVVYRVDNTAYKYDLNKYRNLSSDEFEEPKRENIIVNKKNIDKSSLFKIILLAVIAMILLFCVIYGKVQISDMYSQVNEQKAKLSTEKSENTRLTAELESYTSLKNIEDFADELGLEKIDKAQIRYIDIQNEDDVEIPKNDDNLFIKLKKLFNRISEYISS